jgi:hypothetical protein
MQASSISEESLMTGEGGVGVAVGNAEGVAVGEVDGASVGAAEGALLGAVVGVVVGAALGNFKCNASKQAFLRRA